MSLRQEHIKLLTEMDSPVLNTVEKFYRANPSKYSRAKIKNIKVFPKLVQTHIIHHLEKNVIHIKGYRVPRHRYYQTVRALTPAGWQNVVKARYTKAYHVKGYWRARSTREKEEGSSAEEA